MKIGGFQELSLLDFPGHPCAVIWTVGCNFRCPFCYNPELVTGTAKLLDTHEVFAFLEKRKAMLEGVSVTGGEPLLQEDIDNFLEKVKGMGLLTKIDHNGTLPQRIEELLDRELLDFVAVDVKSSPKRYAEAVGVSVDVDTISQTIDLVKRSGIEYEFRTTVVPSLVDFEDLLEIAEWLKGANKWVLQQFQTSSPLLETSCQSQKPYSREQIWEWVEELEQFVQKVEVRGE